MLISLNIKTKICVTSDKQSLFIVFMMHSREMSVITCELSLTLSCPGTAIAVVKVGHSNLRPGSKELKNCLYMSLFYVFHFCHERKYKYSKCDKMIQDLHRLACFTIH